MQALKREKDASQNSTDDEACQRPSKQLKNIGKKTIAKPFSKLDESVDEIDDSTILENTTLKRNVRTLNKRKLGDQTVTIHESMQEPANKKANLSKNDTNKYFYNLGRISEKSKESKSPVKKAKESFSDSKIINETLDETVEPSLYEDAINRPMQPVMSSTMNPESTATLDRILGASVAIEPIPKGPMFDKTVTLNKRPSDSVSDYKPSILSLKQMNHDPKLSAARVVLKKNIRIDDLLTDDESSPERKSGKNKRITRSSSSAMSDGDQVPATPKNKLPTDKEFKIPSAIKSVHKRPPLFSPYAKDSVKRRVEAFEQVALSPKSSPAIAEDVAGRVTRNKMRALAAAASVEIPVFQKLARKSLVKAKKISLAKQIRDEETKEVSTCSLYFWILSRFF